MNTASTFATSHPFAKLDYIVTHQMICMEQTAFCDVDNVAKLKLLLPTFDYVNAGDSF